MGVTIKRLRIEVVSEQALCAPIGVRNEGCFVLVALDGNGEYVQSH
jgi:hypothetical protein